MYAVAAGSILECAFEGQQDGTFVQNVFHYKLGSGSPVTDGNAFLNAFNTLIQGAGKLYTAYIGAVSQDVDPYKIYLQWITPVRYRQLAFDPVVPRGVIGELAFPVNVAVAITKYAEKADRHGLGTTHMPGVPQPFVTGSELTQEGFNSYQTFAAVIPNELVMPTGQTMSPVVFNRKEPDQSQRIVAANTMLQSRTMRRRTLGVGI